MSGVQIATSTSELQYAIQGYNGISLTNWTVSSASVIAAGSGVEVAGAFFRFSVDDTNDATSFSAITTGATAYLVLTPSGTAGSQIVTSSWTSTAPVWRMDFNGWYLTAASAIRAVAGVVKTGAASYESKFILQDRGTLEGVDTITGKKNFSAITATTATVSGVIPGGSAVITGAASVSGAVSVGGVISAASGIIENSVTIIRKIIEIGDWNMDSTASISVSHGLDVSKIRAYSAFVRPDSGESLGFDLYNLGNVGTASLNGGIILSSDGTTFFLNRQASGLFDTTSFNATSYNRGWIFVEYVA